ncbi:KAP family P-loop NTPase fold protein [Pandoraea anapnoica]|nr:P-loop NTPase fold protein [Pandoraea anapnoica]
MNTIAANDDESSVANAGFKSDKLDRLGLAEHLTRYICRLKNGAVIGIDGPWGSGKSWFARNWRDRLRSQGFKVAYIDAFQDDYTDDPFTLVASEINLLIKSSGNDGEKRARAFVEKAARVATVIAPAAGKIAINAVGKVLGTTGNLSDVGQDIATAIADSSGGSAEQWIRKKIEGYVEDKRSLAEFQNDLREFSKLSDKPVIVMVDELDRCRPDFAVGLIERIKHLFDVENLVFVLLMNRRQLSRAVEGVYGVGDEAPAYLSKFINIYFQFPVATVAHGSQSAIRRFTDSVLAQYEWSSPQTPFADALVEISPFVDFTLRDIERAVALYSYAHPTRLSARGLTYIAVLKVKRPADFQRIVAGDDGVHLSLFEWLIELEKRAIADDHSHARKQMRMAMAIHWPYLTIADQEKYSSEFSAEFNERWRIEKHFCTQLVQAIDIPIE